MDYDGWYGRDNVFRHMVDVQFVAAMGPPGGGRTFVSNRYTRHFNNLGLANVRGTGGGERPRHSCTYFAGTSLPRPPSPHVLLPLRLLPLPPGL